MRATSRGGCFCPEAAHIIAGRSRPGNPGHRDGRQDGLSYLRELMESHRNLPVVISSAYPSYKTTSHPGWRRPTWSNQPISIPQTEGPRDPGGEIEGQGAMRASVAIGLFVFCCFRLGTDPGASLCRHEEPMGLDLSMGFWNGQDHALL